MSCELFHTGDTHGMETCESDGAESIDFMFSSTLGDAASESIIVSANGTLSQMVFTSDDEKYLKFVDTIKDILQNVVSDKSVIF